MAHSLYSASGFEAARLCPGKPVLEQGLPDNGNAYSREGTAAHKLLELCLTENRPAAAYDGRIIEVEGDRFPVDIEMVDAIQWCLDQIEVYAAGNAALAETRVNYSRLLAVKEDEAWGTADVLIARDDELIVMDLKYGRGVEVNPDCDQTRLYALGALDFAQGVLGDFTRVRAVILQPRISRKPAEWDTTVSDLEDWALSVARQAVLQRQKAVALFGPAGRTREEWDGLFLVPGEKQCKFCKAKATCPALRDEVAETVGLPTATAADFEESDINQPTSESSEVWLSACLDKVDMIEDWCKAIRAEAERRLLDGQEIPGYKLVAGKKGARQWADAAAAEAMLKKFRIKLEDMYDMKLISPTTAEKLAKVEVIGKRQWPQLKELITQAEGKPHVAPESDSRPALVRQPVAEMFDPAEQTHDDIA